MNIDVLADISRPAPLSTTRTWRLMMMCVLMYLAYSVHAFLLSEAKPSEKTYAHTNVQNALVLAS